MKIIFGVIGNETNTFSSEIGTFQRWASGWAVGQDVLNYFRNVPGYYIGGMLRAAQEAGAEVIPTVNLMGAGPVIRKEALDYAMDTMCGIIAQHKDEADGICMGLHGAGVAEGVDDLETYTLEKVREIVGDEMPITVSLDLHGNITDDMVRLSDGLFGLKEYPHVDMADAGYLAMKSLIRILRGEIHPETAVAHIPMFTNLCNANTFDMPMREFKEHVAAYVKEHGLIDATFFQGFPYADVACAGASVVVVAERGQNAQAAADELARWVWDHRHALDVECLSPAQALDRAAEELQKPGKGYVVINDAADNPGGGCPCDGTWLLQELLRRDVPRSILGYLHDPEMAEKAHAAGVGGTVSGLLGGKTDQIHGAPVEIRDALVCALSDGKAVCVSPMMQGAAFNYGKTARLRIGQVEVVVSSLLAGQTLDDRPFLVTGADINDYDIVCVKSTNHFRAFFQSRAKAIVTTNPPGIHTADYSLLTYHKIRRPIYPLDPETTF
ncbi:M81 family metallopeptidase [uncultured Mailhella sp.]|uniref:M81 family metallopeptidase n=1 Tax=uncultured Mailhella sp. TaxID=1981031 RepID=UPI0026019492|nr:M81 family metallopeptidase [uncultured Mailhella sp.]